MLHNLSRILKKFSILILIIFIFLTICLSSFLILYYFCLRKKVEKRFYGSRLIVNDEDKSKENSPQTKLPTNQKNDYAVITKQRKVCTTNVFMS